MSETKKTAAEMQRELIFEGEDIITKGQAMEPLMAQRKEAIQECIDELYLIRDEFMSHGENFPDDAQLWKAKAITTQVNINALKKLNK